MKNVFLVFGGESYEHDISVVTAAQIFNKSSLDDINIVPIYVSRENDFFVYNANKIDVKDFSVSNFNKQSKKFKEVAFVSGEYGKLFLKTRWGLKEYLQCDIALFACHGADGENGKLETFFEKHGIFSSAGSDLALAISMNKFLFKKLMIGIKVPVVKGFLIDKKIYLKQPERYQFYIRFMKFPVVLKSNNGGSSIGLFVAKNRVEFDEKLKESFEFDDEVLIENYISKTREFNVAVLGDKSDFVVSEIDEPLKENDVLTFADKYLSCAGKQKGTKLNSMVSQGRKIPADIPITLERKIKKIAGHIFEKLNFRGIVRIDFLFDEKNNKLYTCEVNAIPGSLGYYFFDKFLIKTDDLIKKLVQVAEKAKENKLKINKEFQTNVLD